MIPQCPGAQVCGSLRDQLRAPHVRVPERGGRDGELDALLGDIVGGILVAGRQVHVVGSCAGAVDIPLIRTNFKPASASTSRRREERTYLG
jgi:hypothetical protein